LGVIAVIGLTGVLITLARLHLIFEAALCQSINTGVGYSLIDLIQPRNANRGRVSEIAARSAHQVSNIDMRWGGRSSTTAAFSWVTLSLFVFCNRKPSKELMCELRKRIVARAHDYDAITTTG